MKNTPSLPILLLLLLSLLVSHPSHATPASTRAQREAAVNKAIDWLHNQLLMGEIDGMSTCDAARVIALAGENPDAARWTLNGNSLLTRCENAFQNLVRKDAGEGAKALRAALAAGRDPRHFAGTDLIAFIEGEYDPSVGFYHDYNLFRNNLAIIALSEAGRPIPPQAVAALAAEQNQDGCWGWPIGGDVTDTDTSGLTLHALAAAGRADHPAISQCVARLRAMQNDDGGWELSGIYGDKVSNVNSTALVVQGLVAVGWDPEGLAFTRDQTAIQALLSFQADDGAFWWRHDQPGALLLGTIQAIQPLLMTYPNEIPKPIRLHHPLVIR
ncbi:MAG TPA: hypothetical protein EYP25_01300 [Anaerolineae bacterium]|nr:hypothetical protein [Anaerolineae bacterium]HIQ11650.1 hypothetical protein [Caldilineales bacterium]